MNKKMNEAVPGSLFFFLFEDGGRNAGLTGCVEMRSEEQKG